MDAGFASPAFKRISMAALPAIPCEPPEATAIMPPQTSNTPHSSSGSVPRKCSYYNVFPFPGGVPAAGLIYIPPSGEGFLP